MAWAQKIQDTARAIAVGLASAAPASERIITRIFPYNRALEKMVYGEGLLTLASAERSATQTKKGVQEVTWDLQVMLGSDQSSDSAKVEQQIAELLAADSTRSVFALLRGVQRSIGKPELTFHDVVVGLHTRADGAIVTLLVGKVTALI